ncbi:hypothetical protein RUM44_006382 [Polyplax serrata]|uniref:Uncharacterized protein n=1 Tax=Polyplax serrata TaxID=468196 RepID=A0ABR1AHY0_POLSC
MPPWNIDVIEDMTADLDGSLSNLGADLAVGSYNMSEALLSLPSLTVFKQEAPSPSHEALLSNLQSNSDDVHDNNTTLHRLLQQNNSHGALKRNSSGLPSEQVKVHEKKNEDFRCVTTG